VAAFNGYGLKRAAEEPVMGAGVLNFISLSSPFHDVFRYSIMLVRPKLCLRIKLKCYDKVLAVARSGGLQELWRKNGKRSNYGSDRRELRAGGAQE
jgi:hypothetical protein